MPAARHAKIGGLSLASLACALSLLGVVIVILTSYHPSLDVSRVFDANLTRLMHDVCI
jgi:hypothetical protein